MWLCPVCHEELIATQSAVLQCPAGHSYDRAREGYVNLLLANRKRSQQPGDDKAMISARRRVHDAGLYRTLADAISQVLQDCGQRPAVALDLGCGEGFYTAAIAGSLPAATLCGVDIAKPAVKLAARRCREAEFAVASAFDVPLADSSIGLVTSIFAPLHPQEIVRLLEPGGLYLKVTPAAQHLWELRCLLYDSPVPHQQDSELLEGFEVLAESQLDYSVQISGDLLRDLVAMTPYAHRGQREHRDKLDQQQKLSIQMSFCLSLQRKPG